MKEMESWCESNCNHSPPFCPVDMCSCVRQDTESSSSETEEPTTQETTTYAGPCYLKNKMLKGKLIKKAITKTTSQLECWTKCSENSKCRGFTYIAKHKKAKLRNSCYLYSKVKKQRKKKNYISGMMDATC